MKQIVKFFKVFWIDIVILAIFGVFLVLALNVFSIGKSELETNSTAKHAVEIKNFKDNK